MLGVTVTGVPQVLSPSASVSTVMALGVGLAAGCAAIVVRGWGRDARVSTLGALLFGFAPFLTSAVVGFFDITLIAIPPLVFLALNEVLIKRQRLAFFVGAVVGYVAAVSTLHSTPALICAALSAALSGVVIAMCRPAAASMPITTIVQAAVGGVLAYVLATAYPIAVTLSGPRGVNVSVRDNGSALRRITDSVMPSGQYGFGNGGVATYLVAGLLAAGVVEWFRRTNLRWSLLPVGALGVIAFINLFPRFSVHP